MAIVRDISASEILRSGLVLMIKYFGANSTKYDNDDHLYVLYARLAVEVSVQSYCIKRHNKLDTVHESHITCI